MRNLILVIALTVVPLGIWTAGCRDDSQAAFPDTPEMRSLAKSGKEERVSEVATSAPVIPAKPIDREILHYPDDNGALARVRAAADRANLYAAESAGRGLFALPEESNYVASAPARPAAAPASANIPAPSAKEFWSKPVAARPARNDRSDRGDLPQRETAIPDDISAMAAPSRSADDMMFIPPAPTAAPARRPAQDTLLILPPADLPGVFTPGEIGDGVGFDDAPPESASPPSRRWFGMLRRDRGDARSAPPASSRRVRPADRPAEVSQNASVFMPVPAPVSALTTASEPFPPIAPGARIVSSEGMDFEPLPEPIPLSQYNSMVMDELAKGIPGTVPTTQKPIAQRPAAKKSELLSAPVLPLPAALISARVDAPAAAPAPTIPELTPELAETKPGAAKILGISPEPPQKALNTDKFANAKKALEPLPNLSTRSPAPVTLPAPMPAELPTPEAAAAKATLLLSPEAMDEAFEELNKEDFFKADFWEPAAKTKTKQPAPEKLIPEKPKTASPLPAIPELTDPLKAPAAPAASFIPLPPPLIEEEPKKVILQPLQKSAQKSTATAAALKAIDAATEVPPLKF